MKDRVKSANLVIRTWSQQDLLRNMRIAEDGRFIEFRIGEDLDGSKRTLIKAYYELDGGHICLVRPK